MKYHFTILHSFFIVFSFIVLTSALVIDKRSVELVIDSKLPTITYHFQKKDLIDLHHSGSKTTTTTTATSKPQSTPEPSVVPSSNPEAIYGGKGITPQNGVAGGILIVLGLYLMVFGFRSFRITLGVCGFLTFGLITWVAMANNQPFYGYMNNDITIVAVPFGLGLLGVIIYALFWNISIYLVGALGGFALSMYILCCRPNLVITQVVARAAFLVAVPFFVSFITFFAERYVLLFTFSFVGSYCFIVGIEFLAHTGYLAGIKSILDGNPYHQVVYEVPRNVIILIVFIQVIFLMSFAWQFMYNQGQKFGVVFVEEVEEKGGHTEGDKGDDKDKSAKDGPGDPGKVNKDEPHIETKD